MFDDSRSFISRAFLRANYDIRFQVWLEEGQDARLLDKLKAWTGRARLTETQDEAAFIQLFFAEEWKFAATGTLADGSQTLLPKFSVAGAGARGGPGEADLALGLFHGRADAVPQVLCEFKDIRSSLDLKQNRKGQNFSPVEQCLNYVRHARRGQFGNEPVQPWWGLVTDMNEFRLYWWDKAPREYLRFTISKDKGKAGQSDLFQGHDLLSDGEEAAFDRFLFATLFSRDMLVAPSGRPQLWRMVERQWLQESKLEETFYTHYKGVRERLFNVLTLSNPDFGGSQVDLLRVSQKLLDRFIFAFYCEDMGERMLFPPQFIRDYLRSRSIEPHFDASGGELWAFFKRLFASMNSGEPLGEMPVPHINGGLFAEDALIGKLSIPNHVFVARSQGANETNRHLDITTLYFLSARYNYASRGNAHESLSLYTLGRIFEQSITELEYKAGELEGRDSVAKLSKRKRDGVYYTPESTVNYLVEETMEPWLAAARARAGFTADGTTSAESVARYRETVRVIRIVDPACGSGAFLISAFRKLLDERKQVEKMAVAAGLQAIEAEESALIAEILSANIFGVDINPASVEIAKLALWLHSARADAPLSSLSDTLKCGNSLITPDCWQMFDRNDEREVRINPFDWHEAFPQVFAAGGFDIVLGNPPYVKLQNLMKVDPEVVRYLTTQRPGDTYESAQTGNLDLYLPFIEKGLRLLAAGGRMAYIAPSLWTVNEYGAGLRRLIHRTRQLDRFVDFKSFQVFKEAITYTALQFFTREPNDTVRIVISPEGETGEIDWKDASLGIPYTGLPAEDEWLLATGPDRDLIERLWRDCPRLSHPDLTSGIIVGIQTSADSIYHLRRVSSGHYECSPKEGAPYVVEIEDALMKPLVSGAEAQRYQSPKTDTYLLFPYERTDGGAMRLIAPERMARDFPYVWAHLGNYEAELRGREKGAFDDTEWYRFGRSQNIDKQEMPKLMVPRLVKNLYAACDPDGGFYLDNVDVGGVVPARGQDPWFLLGVMNGHVGDFVFRRVSKPFQNGYWSANKQFIAPIPIPVATIAEKAKVAALARTMQEGWTRRRDLLTEAADRLGTVARSRKLPKFLWPDLAELADLKDKAPKRLKAGEKLDWAKENLKEQIEQRTAALQGILDTGPVLSARYGNGELQLQANGVPVLSRIYLDETEGRIIETHWNWLAQSRRKWPAESLVRELIRPPAASDSAAARQFAGRVNELEKLSQELKNAEKQMNALLFQLYNLSTTERLLVEKDCAKSVLS